MVDVKQAIQRAKEYAVQILEVDPEEILLEEIQPSAENWTITLSFRARGGMRNIHALASLGDSGIPVRQKYDYRELKSFRINRTTGEVEGMYNVQPI
jgi:hypothetical protein